MATSWRFDRGTLIVHGPCAASWQGVVWDDRTQNYRASAHRYAVLKAEAVAACEVLDDPLPQRWSRSNRPWTPLPLRPYQRDALTTWLGQGKRGVIVLPTGAGKTRIAVGAAGALRVPTAILCPTRVLLGQWVTTLRETYGGEIGAVGDGEQSVEDVTVMTFESAFRQMDGLGDRFALLIVDEVHHFASGVRGEALEACAAPYRLGLTATAPELGSAGASMLANLVGPVVFAMSIGDLAGSHLATFEVVRLRVALTREEHEEYQRLSAPFIELRDNLLRAYPTIDWEATLRAMSRTAEGQRAVAGWQRAVALALFPSSKRRLAADLIERHRADKTLVFTAHAADARTLSCDNLVPAITAEIAREEREVVLARFHEGRVRCLVSARVLNEGVDVPDANVAILLGGALGVREQVQRVGRVLRPSPGKRAIVYDVATEGTIDAHRSDRKWRKLAAASVPSMPS
jgi:superfamily II DNA or RNA helicase